MMNALRAVLALALILPSPALAADLELGAVGERPVVAPVALPTTAIMPIGIDAIKVSPIVNVDLAGAQVRSLSAETANAAQTASAQATAVSAAATAMAETVVKAAKGSAAAAKTTIGTAAALAAPRAGVPADEQLNAAYDASYTPDNDGVAAPRGIPEVMPTVARPSVHAPVKSKLKKASHFSFVRKLSVPAIAVGLLSIAAPAFAQGGSPVGGPVIDSAGSLAWLSAVHPLVAAGGALIGAAYGLIASRRADGAEPSAGDVLASILRYGALGGAGAYVLLDLTRMAFLGPSVGLTPLAAAVATAALGRTAFQGKFADPSTTSADRVIGAFPAVAAALGLSIGVALAAPSMLFQAATAAMAMTGLATAIYSAVFKPGRSPAKGPSLMGKGYVMQALFSGLALALPQTSWLVWAFAGLAVAGVALVNYAFVRELLSLAPKKPAKP